MANQYLNQVALDANNSGVTRTDEVLVSRNSQTYRATLDKVIPPPPTTADAGKILRVNSTGTDLVWGSPAIVRETIYTLAAGLAPNVQGTLSTGKRFDRYMGFTIGYAYGNSNSTQTTWSPQIFFTSHHAPYAVSSLRGTGWALLTTSGDNKFTITSSHSSFRVFRIEAVTNG